MKYGDLRTGDLVKFHNAQAVVMAIEKEHPREPGFWLIVWYLVHEKRLTFDCLSPHYEVMPGSSVSSDGLVTWSRVVSELAAPR